MLDHKRYRIAPWRGRYGDQAHQLRLHYREAEIARALARKRDQLKRMQEQVHQLEELEKRCHGTVIDGVLVREQDVGGPCYGLGLVTDFDSRWAKVYPNAHNGGRTFGYHIHWSGQPFGRDEWQGAGHTLEQAIEGARAWVVHARKSPRRFDTPEGIREEPATGIPYPRRAERRDDR